MPDKRFIVREFCGAQAIKDTSDSSGRMMHAFGHSVHVPWDRHRQYYAIEDAQAVCDWLNSRGNGYPELNRHIYRKR